jgi:hypothetical protein
MPCPYSVSALAHSVDQGLAVGSGTLDRLIQSTSHHSLDQFIQDLQ